MAEPGVPDQDGWLRATPVAEIRIKCNGVPLSGAYDETAGRLILDDPDLALRPIELQLSVDSEVPASQPDTTTLADVLTDVHTERQEAIGEEWIVISPYGTCVQLRINGEPMEVVENIPDDGIALADPTVPDPTEILLEAKDHIPEPEPAALNPTNEHSV